MPDASDRSVLLIIGGGIAAYKSLFLIRLLRERGVAVTGVLTRGGSEFITALSVGGLTERKCYQDLFDLTDEAEMGHIELSRQADLVVCAPATANLLAKAANGLADDLASTILMATDKKVLFAPAMNVRMWLNPATQRSVTTLAADGAIFVGPDDGAMACGEFGPGRMAEPAAIADAICAELGSANRDTGRRSSPALVGRRVLVTAGPTHEPLDPVRYIANRSSGKQGYAIAEAARDAGADVTLVTGPTNLEAPARIQMVRVETAREMMQVCQSALPVDVAIFCAAVADYRPDIQTDHKIKKERGGLKSIPLAENPDILRTIASMTEGRPAIVIGFAAETDDVVGHAEAKRRRKGCDWIVANDVSPGTGTMGGDRNRVVVIDEKGEDVWPDLSKREVAVRLVDRIAETIRQTSS
jgi:phosphopantothenoylcysteine decarboxylase/phosphopantothenate--cysteine ligase